MYNVEKKEKYFEKESMKKNYHQNAVKAIFKKFAPIEELYGKDLYDFSFDEILSAYTAKSYTSLEMLMNVNSQLKLYTQYIDGEYHCLADGQNHYSEIDWTDLYECLNHELIKRQRITKAELDDIIDNSLVNPSDKCFLLAIYEGLGGKSYEDFINLTMNDIVDKTVPVNRKKCTRLPISDRLYDLMNQSAHEYTYWSVGGKTNTEYHYNLNDIRVFKEFSNVVSDKEQSRVRNFRSKMERLQTLTKCPGLMKDRIRDAGRNDLMRKYIKENKYTSVFECLQNHPDVTDRYGDIGFYMVYQTKFQDILFED